jgi:E3 ubiquitin-protein ligase MARCH6
MQLGWTRPDPIMATKELIAPLVGGLLGMIIIPGAVYKAVLLYFPDAFQDNRFTCERSFIDVGCIFNH